jgi:hypothetical protein
MDSQDSFSTCNSHCDVDEHLAFGLLRALSRFRNANGDPVIKYSCHLPRE